MRSCNKRYIDVAIATNKGVGSDMSKYWQKWLSLWAGSVALFGLILAGGGFAVTDGPVRFLFGFMAPEAFQPTQSLRFAVGLMGAVTFGWGCCFLALFAAIAKLDATAAAPVWRFATVATLAWYFVDSAISISNGFGWNAVSNSIFLILFLVPLLSSGALRADSGARSVVAK
jgi:hypothetical protein